MGEKKYKERGMESGGEEESARLGEVLCCFPKVRSESSFLQLLFRRYSTDEGQSGTCTHFGMILNGTAIS